MTELKSHENNIAKFEFNVSYDDFKKATDTVYKRNKKRYRIDGFRPGHVPSPFRNYSILFFITTST